MKLFIGCALLAVAAAESTLEALEADDTCVAGDCSLELNQLRGMKVNYHDALMEEDEVEVTVEGGACTDPADLGVWKKGGRREFDGQLNQCGRSCAAGFPLHQGLHAEARLLLRVCKLHGKTGGVLS